MTFGGNGFVRGGSRLALLMLVACGGGRGVDPTRNIPLEDFSPEQIFLLMPVVPLDE